VIAREARLNWNPASSVWLGCELTKPVAAAIPRVLEQLNKIMEE